MAALTALPSARRGKAIAGADQQRGSEQRLHILQIDRERGLGDVQPFGGPRQRAPFNDFDKIPELAEIHHAI